MSYFVLLSPAKLNLSLKVISKRDDGYHNINSIVQKISLYDIIKIKILQNDLKKVIFHNIKVDPKRNSITKAIEIFKQKTNLNFGYEVLVYKYIPVEAGLGGGSSNAGVVLKFLNNIFKKKLSKKELIQIAVNIGADVPLFIYDESLLLIKGIGEKVYVIKELNYKYKWFLLVKPNFSLSTKKVYSKLNFILTNFNKNIMEISPLEIGYNDLEKSAFKIEPLLKEIKFLLSKYTPFALLTGSGSTVFAGFTSKDELLNCYRIIKEPFKDFKIIISRAI